jgi:hypothetical protein
MEKGYMASGFVLHIDRHNAPHPVAFHVEAEALSNGVGHKTSSQFLVTNFIEKATCLPSGVSFASNSFSARLRRMDCISEIKITNYTN